MSAILFLNNPKLSLLLSTILDSDIGIFASVSPSLSLQLDVQELLTGGPNGTKDARLKRRGLAAGEWQVASGIAGGSIERQPATVTC